MPDRVLITEAVHAGLEPLGHDLLVDLEPELWSDRRSLLARVAESAAIVVRNQTRVDRELVNAAMRLRAVGRLGAGLDNLDLEALRERGVAVLHGGGLNACAVAEYVVAAALHLARGLGSADREVRAGTWQRRVGRELRGRTIGVVGLGATGAETARLARALGMRALGHDPYSQRPLRGVTLVPLDELLQRSFVVTVHVPLSEATRRLIGSAALEAMPPGGLVVNAARGGVVDEGALYRALASGHLGGAALDVRASEPPGQADRFAQLDNVLLTPHIAGLTAESQSAIATSVLGDVRRVLSGSPPTGPAIVPSA